MDNQSQLDKRVEEAPEQVAAGFAAIAVRKLAMLPLLVPGSQKEVFQAIRALQERARHLLQSDDQCLECGHERGYFEAKTFKYGDGSVGCSYGQDYNDACGCKCDFPATGSRTCAKCGAQLIFVGEQVWRCPNADAENTGHHTVLQVVEIAATGAGEEAQRDPLVDLLLPVIYKAANEPCRSYARGCPENQPDQSYWCAPCEAREAKKAVELNSDVVARYCLTATPPAATAAEDRPREVFDAGSSAPTPAPARCVNCEHSNPHDGPAGAVNDACIHPCCNCGYYVPSTITTSDRAREIAVEVLEWLNFDTSLDAVAADIYGVQAIISERLPDAGEVERLKFQLLAAQEANKLGDKMIAEARATVIRECVSLAEVMATGETYETGRQKALNIAAALQSLLDKKEGEDETSRNT